MTQTNAPLQPSQRATGSNGSRGQGMTPPHGRVLRFIEEYQRTHGGVSPSVRDVALGVGNRSHGNVSRYIARLVDIGRLKRVGNRALIIVEPRVTDTHCLCCGQELTR